MSYNQVFDLVGGDRKQYTDSVLKDIEKRLEDLWDIIFDPLPADLQEVPALAAAVNTTVCTRELWFNGLNSILKKKNFSFGSAGAGTPAPDDAKEQIRFLNTVREILAKAQGSYLGEDIKVDIGDSAEVARYRIKQDPKEAFGPSNRQLAYKVSSALKMLLKDFGDDALYKLPDISASSNQVTAALANLERAFASLNQQHKNHTNRRVNML